MTKPERGVKRECAICGTRFFDLQHEPIICPKCQAVFVVPEPPPSRGGGFVHAPKQEARRPPAESPEGLLEPDEGEAFSEPEEDEEAPQALDEDGEAPHALDEGIAENELGSEDLSDEE